MATINLENSEIKLVKKSINHCIETCRQGGEHHGCPDCEALEGVLNKLSGTGL